MLFPANCTSVRSRCCLHKWLRTKPRRPDTDNDNGVRASVGRGLRTGVQILRSFFKSRVVLVVQIVVITLRRDGRWLET